MATSPQLNMTQKSNFSKFSKKTKIDIAPLDATTPATVHGEIGNSPRTLM